MIRRVLPVSTDVTRIRRELVLLGADPYCLGLADKGIGAALKINALSCGQANILKQEAIASGVDAMVARGTVSCAVDSTDVLVLGQEHGVRILAGRLMRQPIGLAAIGRELNRALDQKKPKVLDLRGEQVPLDKTLLMAIVNMTPDSFSDGGVYTDTDAMNLRLDVCANAGVDIVDVGGESTRPGADRVSAEEEMERVIPVVESARKRGLRVSVDTCKSSVAKAALDAGAVMINDISGLHFDPEMGDTVAKAGGAVCVMHIKGTPKDMQKNPTYEDVTDEVKASLLTSVERAEAAGVSPASIVIDPGFGFGKTVEHNYELLARMNEFTRLGFPVMAGISRKSMIGSVIGKPVTDRVYGTIAAESAAILGGAAIVRVHDIEATRDMIRVLDMMKQVAHND